jgi:hypothetical protein
MQAAERERAPGALLRDRLRLPHGWRDAVLQLALWGVADLCYETVRGISEGRRSAAFANAQWIIDLERATGTFFEPRAQSLVLDHPWLVHALNWGYMNVHFTVTTLVLAWMYLFRNGAFYRVRNVFMIAMAIALLVHAVLPVAPPRMFPGEGFVDTIKHMSGVDQDAGAVSLLVNSYAAVPSMHICFALILGLSMALLARRRIASALWSLYPALVLALVVLTANHFWLDAAAGAAVAIVAAALALTVVGRRRVLQPRASAEHGRRAARW